MENVDNASNKNEPFDPEEAFTKMLELNNKASELAHSNREFALIELKEIVKEITRLARLRKDYYEEQIAELKKIKDVKK